MPNDVPLNASTSHTVAERIHSDPDATNASNTIATEGDAQVLGDRSVLEHMIRRPTEEDFKDVLKPEGNSGDIVGSDVSGGIGVSNDSVGGI